MRLRWQIVGLPLLLVIQTVVAFPSQIEGGILDGSGEQDDLVPPQPPPLRSEDDIPLAEEDNGQQSFPQVSLSGGEQLKMPKDELPGKILRNL